MLAESNKGEKIVDISGALLYLLSPVPAALCMPDGVMGKKKKSDFLNILEEDIDVEDSDTAYASCDVCVQDLAAYVRTVISHCKTIRDIGTQLVKSIQKECKKAHVKVDSYASEGIKSRERMLRGAGERYVLRNIDMKVPYNLNNYLAIGENKEELFMLIQQSVEEQSLNDCSIFFCYQNKCVNISAVGVLDLPGLASNYEEADYMFIAYAVIEEGNILIRSPSGDVDIVAMLVGHLDSISAMLIMGQGRTEKC